MVVNNDKNISTNFPLKSDDNPNQPELASHINSFMTEVPVIEKPAH